MPQAPHIDVYEILPGEPAKKVGRLCGPEEFFAYAAALTFVENSLGSLGSDDGRVQKLIALHKQCIKGMPASVDEPFGWYCQVCQELAALTEEQSWRENPKHFSKMARAYLVGLLFSGQALEGDSAGVQSAILKIYNRLIEDELKDWDRPASLGVKIVRVVLFPLGLILRARMPRYAMDLKKEKMQRAHVLSQKLIRLCTEAKEKGRVFTFEPPEDQVGEPVDLGGLRIAIDREGGVSMG